VYNRRFFDEALPREMSKAERHRLPLLLFMIDIDDFKTYNEANLHQGGDEALAQIGEVLKKACRAYDIVTRYGGDEFAVLFPGAGKDNVHELSGRITRDVRNYPFNGLDALPSGHMSVSIGAACYPDDATTPRELVRKADEAMARAKLLGKDRLALYERGA
jgi:diguanylate cyclase (GGDEF)-like protein